MRLTRRVFIRWLHNNDLQCFVTIISTMGLLDYLIWIRNNSESLDLNSDSDSLRVRIHCESWSGSDNRIAPMFLTIQTIITKQLKFSNPTEVTHLKAESRG